MMSVDCELQPQYRNKAIRSTESFARALGVEEDVLRRTAARVSRLYRPSSKPEKKSDGSVRQTFDAKLPLKFIQGRIKDRILRRVIYPTYLTGSIRDPNNPRHPTSNAAMHCGFRVLFKEDVKSFFPSISWELVYRMWMRLFGFSDEVAQLLADLTTYHGYVPEGARTSSYIANLALWDVEPALVQRLHSMDFVYSRYVDDITISAHRNVATHEKTEVIRCIHGMLESKGFKLNRRKHHIGKKGQAGPEGEALTVTGLTASGTRPGVCKEKRRRTRAAVREVEKRARAGQHDPELLALFRSTEGRVRRLVQHGHPEGEKLEHRLGLVWPSVARASGFTSRSP